LQHIFNTSNIGWWIGLFDAFYSREFNNIPLPNGITEDMVQQISNLTLWQLKYLYKPKTLVTLGIGTFMDELLSRMEDNLAGATNPKWIYYSAHDVTLALILSGLDVFEGQKWPPFTGNLIFELFQDGSKGTYVRLIYNTKVLVIPGCKEYCPYDQFYRTASAIRVKPDQWKNMCGLGRTGYQNSGPNQLDNSVLSSPDSIVKYFC